MRSWSEAENLITTSTETHIEYIPLQKKRTIHTDMVEVDFSAPNLAVVASNRSSHRHYSTIRLHNSIAVVVRMMM